MIFFFFVTVLAIYTYYSTLEERSRPYRQAEYDDSDKKNWIPVPGAIYFNHETEGSWAKYQVEEDGTDTAIAIFRVYQARSTSINLIRSGM